MLDVNNDTCHVSWKQISNTIQVATRGHNMGIYLPRKRKSQENVTKQMALKTKSGSYTTLSQKKGKYFFIQNGAKQWTLDKKMSKYGILNFTNLPKTTFDSLNWNCACKMQCAFVTLPWNLSLAYHLIFKMLILFHP